MEALTAKLAMDTGVAFQWARLASLVFSTPDQEGLRRRVHRGADHQAGNGDRCRVPFDAPGIEGA